MMGTPNAERIQIAIFGVRNAGKSSLINAIAGRPVAIVSDVAGTTTDPVSKSMELGNLGAVSFTDTAGLDDEGELGMLRVKKSIDRLSWADIAVLATPLDKSPSEHEIAAFERLSKAGKPIIIAATFCDMPHREEKIVWLEAIKVRQSNGRHISVIPLNAQTGKGVADLKTALMLMRSSGGERLDEASPLEGLVKQGDIVLLVTPIDSAAPRGRLILPEAETLRDALDRGCVSLVCRETELASAYAALVKRPAIVITDSQAFAQVAAAIPLDQKLTSFSILFARKKGELERYRQGLRLLADLAGNRDKDGAIKLLALEACTHNRTHEDIATIKIPALLAKKTGRTIELTVVRELGKDLREIKFDLAVICGGCMATRGKMISQLDALETAGIPVVNFGLFLAWAHGVFPRASLDGFTG